MLETKKKLLSKKTAPTDQIQTALVWFGLVWFVSDFIFNVNRTKPNGILIYPVVRTTF